MQHSSTYLLSGLRSLTQRRSSWISRGLSGTGSWGIGEGSSSVGMLGITGSGSLWFCYSPPCWSLLWDSSFRVMRRFLRTVLLDVSITTDFGISWHFTTEPSVCRSGMQTWSPGDNCSPNTTLCLWSYRSLVPSSPCTSFLFRTIHHNLAV